MMIAALSHLVGGTQERTAGISALVILLGSAEAPISMRGCRSGYCDGATWEFQARTIYVLSHGSRRWAAHEVANLMDMGSWLFTSDQKCPKDGSGALCLER